MENEKNYITYLNTSSNYEVLYDYETEFELPFFNFEFFKDIINHNVRINIHVKEKYYNEVYNVGKKCYEIINEFPIFLYLSNSKFIRMKEYNKFFILLKDKKLIYDGVIKEFEFLKLKVVKNYYVYLKNKIIEVHIDTKKKF